MNISTRALLGSVALSGTALAMTFGSVDRAQAASIVLGNTGTGTYTVSGPAGASNAIVPNGAFPIGPWFDNDSTSSWIGSAGTVPTGNYTYTTTFDLTGLAASTAKISGQWAGDNTGVSILLNGSAADIIANTGSVNLGGFTSFTIGSGANFLAGQNSLAFTIFNANDPGNNPTGLRVAMTGSALTPSQLVPEPADFAGTALAFGSLVLLKRNLAKKKRTST